MSDAHSNPDASPRLTRPPRAFDPAQLKPRRRSKRPAFTVYRRLPDGGFGHEESDAKAVYSEQIGAWLIAGLDDRGVPHLLISRDREGRDIVPTVAAEAQRADAAEARVRELEAMLRRKPKRR